MAKKQTAQPIKTSMQGYKGKGFPATTQSSVQARYPHKLRAKDEISNEVDRPPKR